MNVELDKIGTVRLAIGKDLFERLSKNQTQTVGDLISALAFQSLSRFDTRRIGEELAMPHSYSQELNFDESEFEIQFEWKPLLQEVDFSATSADEIADRKESYEFLAILKDPTNLDDQIAVHQLSEDQVKKLKWDLGSDQMLSGQLDAEVS